MGTLANQRIVLGITGGIAAYKSADIVRRLREAGAEVRVVMTRAACDFITPLTLQAVSGHPVHLHLLDTEAEAAMGHIELARWADAVLVAPASANFIAKLAQGRADDLLSTLCLATAAPVAIAPAMNRQMWDNAATQTNIATLTQRKIKIYGPGVGSQACGEVGVGRMSEPAELVEHLSEIFCTGALEDLNVVVTAGPTWEAIDPVRGLTNRSSGKMGYAVAAAAAEAGARVTLISGPTHLPDVARVQMLRIVSAQEMHDAVLRHVGGAHIFIGAAAVADYRPAARREQKLKKDAATLTLELERNPDILAAVAAQRPRPYVVGFAAETSDLEANARAKLVAKRLDLVAANLVGDNLGFDVDDNALLLIDADGREELPRAAKTQLARALIHAIATRSHAKGRAKDTRQAHRI
ncbi:MAG: bifunctional phosphopantothenoylcysteine decarboxylase/phosphopantothenate--cysteine ligase CoaBC [Gammaproteobacteria bacterium]